MDLLLLDASNEIRQRMDAEIAGIHWLDEADLPRSLRQAEVVFGNLQPEHFADAHFLKWLQLPIAGVTPELCAWAKERGLLLTNAVGIYNQTVAEHCLALMLALARRLDQLGRQQESHVWRSPTDPPIQDLCGSTVALLGTGNIGRGIARLCQGFGMRVLGCRRTLQHTPFVDQLFAIDEISIMLGSADWIVCALPWTRETDRLLRREQFTSMRPGSRFINISRGKVVEEVALIEALEAGHLAGAALDVTEIEPLPSSSPLWNLPRVILTPHCSADPANASPAAAELFLRNLHRYREGLELENVVDLELGY